MKRPRGSAPSSVTAYAAAKVNLGWRVGAGRPDGYHDVSGCLQTISLCDTLRLRTGVTEGEVVTDFAALTVHGPHTAAEDDLVLRALRRLARDVDPVPCSVELTKTIPVAAGLGGGSADAAAALLAASVAWSASLSVRDLLACAADVGSDVPALLIGGLVHVSGRGERVRNVGCLSGTRFVLGISDAELSAGAVYARFDRIGGSAGPSFVANDLEPATLDLHPGLSERLAAMRGAGAAAAFVSGSGPTVVGVVADAAAAQTVALAAAPSFDRLFIADPLPWGVRLSLGTPGP